MSVLRHRIARGRYYDSVVLMQLQRGLDEMEGVHEAGVVMATAANQELLVQSGLLRKPLADARADDLLIAVSAENARLGDEALDRFDELAKARPTAGAAEYRPRSLRVGLSRLPAAGWVLVSVPGRYAAEVARQALAAGRNVFLYSDNVSLEDEVELKRTARQRDLLVLGPDCGTSIIAGVGLGFANRVRRGPVGLIGASGTGLQTIAARLHALGSGISQAIGTGGRDLSKVVGGATASRALALLGADAETRVVVLVSKPPHPKVAERMLGEMLALGKPVVVQFQGYAPPGRRVANLHFAADLEDAARFAAALATAAEKEAEAPTQQGKRTETRGGLLRGLFSGGTLASEALSRLEAVVPEMASNLSGHRAQKLAAAQSAGLHSVLDLGADEFTVGRPHPMIDPQLVAEHLVRAARDREVGSILLDVVLGDGAHPDPAAILAPAVARALAAAERDLEIVVALVGTDEDPQDIEEQRARLGEAGATVCSELGEAVDRVLSRIGAGGAGSPLSDSAAAGFAPPLAAVNVGLELFHRSLVDQGCESIHVDWRPPAGGNERLADILARLDESGRMEEVESGR
jgi:FdrA protein